MKELAIYCAGGFGREVYCMIFNRIIPALISGFEADNDCGIDKNTRFVGYFDDGVWNKYKEQKAIDEATIVPHEQYGQVLGGIEELNSWPTPLDVVIANGSPKWLKFISEHITNKNISFPNVIDPTVRFADRKTNQIGKGNIISFYSSLSCNSRIGNFNVLNSYIGLGHEVSIGDFNVFMPVVRISGDVSIGNENLFGSMSFVLQGIKIGNNIHLTPGSMMMMRPKDGSTYIGNPARRLKI